MPGEVTESERSGSFRRVDGRAARWEGRKREQLAHCRVDLERARADLDTLVRTSHSRGLDVEELEDLGPVSLEIARLRSRGERLADELDAISAEWAG
jgi:hypothetical protein